MKIPALDLSFSTISSVFKVLIFTEITVYRYFLLALLFGCTSSLSAQTAPHPSFRQYTTDNGLSSSETYFIIQDNEGFIWISSDNGVSRFDGYEFRNYGVKEGLMENVIFMMQIDSLGRLWMQAMSGNLYYKDGELIRPYWNNDVLAKFTDRSLSKGFIVEGSGQTIHLATVKYGVITIYEDGRTKTYSFDEPLYRQVFGLIDSTSGKEGLFINAICEQGASSVVQETQKQVLEQKRSVPIYFQTNNKVWKLNYLQFTKREGQAIEAFHLGKGKFLCQIFNDVWFIQNEKVQWHKYYPHHILNARIIDNEQLFVGLHFNDGLRVYSSINAFRYTEGFSWLYGKSVSYFIEDREGGRWFSTNENGVFYAPADAFWVHDKETGLPDEKVTALCIKSEQELYIGLGDGSVWHLSRAAGKWTPLPHVPGNGFIRDIYFDMQSQQLWVAKQNLFYLQNNKWIPFEVSFQGNLLSVGNNISESPDKSHIWVNHHIGFMRIDQSAMKFDNAHLGRDQRTYAVREDFNGAVWAGQSNGLFKWENNKLQSYQHLHPSFSLRVEDIALMPDSTLVIATKGGGIVFWKEDKFEQITSSQGLTADMLECLYADDKGILWAGTLNGLNRISGNWGSRHVEQVTLYNGMPSNEINSIGSYGENVWVATNKGLVRFSNRNKSEFIPQPKLTAVLANNQLLDWSAPLYLSSQQNNLTIVFSAINFKMNGKILYRYRIDKGEWTPTFNRTLNFPELHTGDRLFEVQAQNEDGNWGESAVLRFIINPPWWKSWWAMASLVFIVMVSILGIYKFRTQQLRYTHQIQQQILELERSALQAQMNPHFIFNCLNSIQNYILQNEKQAAIMYLGSFASLVRSMLNASVAGKIPLVEEIKLLNNYLELEKLRFKNRFNYEVRTARELDLFEIKIPPLLVQPYVENAVKHGIADRKSGGMVTVLFEKKDGYLEVIIKDNGKGLSLEASKSLLPKTHKSFGMSITQTRLELLSNGKESQAVDTSVLKDTEGQISGTKVIIRIGLAAEIST